MKNFDVRIVSKDIINGEPLAICVVTHDKQYYSTVKYHYLHNHCETIDIIGTDDIYEMFNISTLCEFVPIARAINSEVREAISNDIIPH